MKQFWINVRFYSACAMARFIIFLLRQIEFPEPLYSKLVNFGYWNWNRMVKAHSDEISYYLRK